MRGFVQDMDFFQLQVDQGSIKIYQWRSEVATFSCILSALPVKAMLQKRR